MPFEQPLQLLLELGVFVGCVGLGVLGASGRLIGTLFGFAANRGWTIAGSGLPRGVGWGIALIGGGGCVFGSRIVRDVARLFGTGLVARQLPLVFASGLQVLFDRRLAVERLGNFDEQLRGRTAVGDWLSIVAGLDPKLESIAGAQVEWCEVKQVFGTQLFCGQSADEQDLVGKRFSIFLEFERQGSEQEVRIAGEHCQGDPGVERFDQVDCRVE
ncbi:MAG: hypothetical protein ACKOJF_29265, partial [Planctomycetaceae bacterium]